MIVRMTVQDNDYASFLKGFASRLFTRLTANSDRKTDNEIINIFKTNETEDATVAQKSFILKEINRIWSEYINNSTTLDGQAKHHLVSNFEVKIVRNFQEKWENGEYVYYFSNSGAVITQ